MIPIIPVCMFLISMKQVHYGMLALAAAAPLQAQAVQEEVSLRFVTFPKTGEPVSFTFMAGEGQAKAIDVPSNAISKPLVMPALPEWVVGEAELDAEGKPAGFKTFGKTRSNGAKKQLIIIIRKGDKPEDGCHLISVDDGQTNFGMGRIFFLNASNKKVGGVAGEDKFAVAPGKHAIVKPKPNETGRFFHVEMFYEDQGKAKGFFSSNWIYSEKSRAMSFIYNDPETKHLRFHTVRDFDRQ